MTAESYSSSSQPLDLKEQEVQIASEVEPSYDADPRNPYNWPLWKKWMTMAVAYWVAILVGINATSFTTVTDALSEEFNISNGFFEYSFFAVTSWNAAAAIVPLATLPMMETFGFRIGYLVCIQSSTANNQGVLAN